MAVLAVCALAATSGRVAAAPVNENTVREIATQLRCVVCQSLSVEECCTEAELQGARRTVKLRVSGAFHSPLVRAAAEHLRPALEKAKFADPIAPFMSTVTAKIEPAQRMASLLVDQLTAPVKFTQAAREMVNQGVTTFVEVGPGTVLSGLLKRIDSSVRALPVHDVASLEAAVAELG